MEFISLFYVRFNSVFYQTKISRKMPKILEILPNLGSRIPVFFCLFPFGLNAFIKEIPGYMKRYNMDNQAQYSEVTQIIMF